MASLTSISIEPNTSSSLPAETFTMYPPDILSDLTHSPAYFLPQSLSNALQFHLNMPSPPLAHNKPLDRSHLTSTLRTIFDISRSPLGDSWVLTHLRRNTGPNVVDARGTLEFTPGWVYGGVFVAEYSICKDGFEVTGIESREGDVTRNNGRRGASKWGRDLLPEEREFEVKIMVDDLGEKNGQWRIVDAADPKSFGTVIAEEVDQVEGESTKERIRFVGSMPAVEGFTEQEIREFVVACWVCKCWRTRNRRRWFGRSARDESNEVAGLRTY